MKKYIALIRVGIQRELVYRTNFCIGIFSTVLLFIVEVAIWSAVYQGTLCAGGCFFLYSVQYFKLYAGNFDILESLKHRALYAENGLCQYFQRNVHSAYILPIDSKGILYGTSVSVYLLFSVDHCNGRSKRGTDCRRNPASVGLDRGIVSAVQADEQECNETDRDSGRVRKSCHIHVK